MIRLDKWLSSLFNKLRWGLVRMSGSRRMMMGISRGEEIRM